MVGESGERGCKGCGCVSGGGGGRGARGCTSTAGNGSPSHPVGACGAGVVAWQDLRQLPWALLLQPARSTAQSATAAWLGAPRRAVRSARRCLVSD